ncbi:MAG TPA: hypothetical protein VMU04_12275, partial [Candidatus Acidoferrum sp.]|nr:hypothetical protein [Candidatus Acidoferrum sp.]
VSQGAATSTNCIFTWPLRLQKGTNTVRAIGTKGAAQVTDSLQWNAPAQPSLAAVAAPPQTDLAYASVRPAGTNQFPAATPRQGAPVPAPTLP